MKIDIVTPVAKSPRTGNRHTAQRYAAFLRDDGHRVRVGASWDGAPTDVLVALHARKSFDSVARYRAARPYGPLVVVLTGTDLYRDIAADASAQRALDLADRLIVLQEKGLEGLPKRLREKTRVVYQSARIAPRTAPPSDRFRVAVIGHLRDEKDPFRAALALGHLDPALAVEVLQIGDALEPGTAETARRLMVADTRYRWLGGAPHWRALRRLAGSHALVLSSKMEGGANVICEAARAGVPVLASRVSGNVGMLGRDYPAYFRLGDERALARLIARAAEDRAFRRELVRRIKIRARLFTPVREHRGLARAVTEAVRVAARKAQAGCRGCAR